MRLFKWLQRPVLQGSKITYGESLRGYLCGLAVLNALQFRRYGSLSLSFNLLFIAVAIFGMYSYAFIERKIIEKK